MLRKTLLLLLIAVWFLSGCAGPASPSPGRPALDARQEPPAGTLPSDVREHLALLEAEPALPDKHLAHMRWWRQWRHTSDSLEDVVRWCRLDAEIGVPAEVQGAWVGCCPRPGRFYLMSLVVSERASVKDLRQLAEDDLLVLRLLAMVCLARTAPRGALPVLASRLASREELICSPLGCVFFEMIEGELAWRLLHDRRYLDGVYPAQPLLPENRLLETDLRLLASEAHAHLHSEIVDHWRRRLPHLPAPLRQKWTGRIPD